jgi:hypothetical protein
MNLIHTDTTTSRNESRNNISHAQNDVFHYTGMKQSIAKKNHGNPLRLIATVMLVFACAKRPAALPSGTWNYALYLNGNKVGSAAISNVHEGGHRVSIIEMTMKAGEVESVSKQIITETTDFKPVKYETYNIIIKGNIVQNINTVATFEGKKVKLSADNSVQEIEIERDFKLEGNYMLAKLIEGKFDKGLKVESYIYEPAIDPEIPVLMKAYVVGNESVTIAGKRYDAVHVIEYIEKFKSFDMYLDGQGALLKAELTMLNMNIQLVRE